MELRECPFCGAATDHKDDCYFSLLPLVVDKWRLHKAWNRRASPASVPEVTDGMAIAFHNALTDGAIGQAEVDEIKTGLRAALAAAPTPPVSEDRWQPIETAPKETTQMFVVVAFGAKVGATPYNSDPWCVWHQRGEFVRWPHKFSPTHWMPLPDAPTMQEDKP